MVHSPSTNDEHVWYDRGRQDARAEIATGVRLECLKEATNSAARGVINREDVITEAGEYFRLVTGFVSAPSDMLAAAEANSLRSAAHGRINPDHGKFVA